MTTLAYFAPTSTPAVIIFSTYSFSFFNPNYAAALTVVLLALLGLLALFQFGFIERRVHYR